ncbi:MAG TPA: MOSC domain-containing protein [Candidatus Tumulicola sp.]|nr:MOSC domain-containing protein [Candidatus Tumulicola sp.]
MSIGTLAGIWRYPIKSLRGEPLERAEVAPEGIPGDRASALFVRSGHARAGRTFRGKEHRGLHLLDGAGEAVAAAARDGVALEPRCADHFFDDAPVSLLIDRWLDELSAHAGYRVEPERFRPNFFVRADRAFDARESDLRGRTLLLGSARLRVRGPIERCVTITYHPQGAAPDPEILRYVATQRDAWMGIYCDVAAVGTVAVGDVLSLAESD